MFKAITIYIVLLMNDNILLLLFHGASKTEKCIQFSKEFVIFVVTAE